MGDEVEPGGPRKRADEFEAARTVGVVEAPPRAGNPAPLPGGD
jgi:hypothetical protein